MFFLQKIEPEIAITLDFNVRSGSVVKSTSILKSRESSVINDQHLKKKEEVTPDHPLRQLKNQEHVQDKYYLSSNPPPPKEETPSRNFELTKSAKKVDIINDDNDDIEKLHTLRYSTGGVLSTKSAQTPNADLPFIDEDDLELDEAIQDATGLAQEQRVQSIQLNATTPNAGSVQGLLVSQRSCSGTDTIHLSEKVIQRDYRDM